MSFKPKDSLVQERELRVIELEIPFTITGNSIPSLVVPLSDEPSILFFRTASVDQITPVLGGEAFPAFANPIDASPGTPLLGTARSYAILGATAVINTGSSVLMGNLGISPNNSSSITGFPPGIYSGMENAANAAAALAQSQALSAYNDLHTRSSTTISSTLDGQTLTAGVYSFASGSASLAASGPGTLTLSGSSTDVFVIQTASTLTTGAGGTPTINLVGGALASNVYWVIGSSATINSGTAGTFYGNVIANTSITVTAGGTVNGSLIALNGAVTLSAATNINVILAPVGQSGLFNILVDVYEPVSKVVAAHIASRTLVPPIEVACYLAGPTGLDQSGTRICLNCPSGFPLNAATTLDVCLMVSYTQAGAGQ